MKNRKNVIRMIIMFLGMVSLFAPNSLKAEETEFSDLRIKGNGIVLTQEEAKTLSDEEILQKANLKAYNWDTDEEVHATFFIKTINVSVAQTIDSLLHSENHIYMKSFDRNNIDKNGMFCYVDVRIQAPGEAPKYLPSVIKMVVLGDSMTKHESVIEEAGFDYVKNIDSILNLSYAQYTAIKEHMNQSVFDEKSEALGMLLENTGHFQSMLNINYPISPDVLYSWFKVKNTSETEFNRFMDLSKAGGTVKLEFEEVFGGAKFNPTVTIIVNPDTTEAIKNVETKEAEKLKAPNTGDSTSLLLISLVGLLSGCILMAKIIQKNKEYNKHDKG